MRNTDQQQFLKAEHLVEFRSAELKKELRLRDLVLTQILYIVGLSWIGYAAKLGPANIVFWLAALVLFYTPSGIVVIHLSREMPLEGGRVCVFIYPRLLERQIQCDELAVRARGS